MLLLGVVASGLAAPAMPRQYMGSEDDMIDHFTFCIACRSRHFH